LGILSDSTGPESALRVSRLEDLAKGMVVDGDVGLNDLGDNFEAKDDDYRAEPNTGYSAKRSARSESV